MLTRHAAPPTAAESPRLPMQDMLRSLPAQHQEIILATYFRGRTTREAARTLGLTHAAANERLYQAMRTLSLMTAIYSPEPTKRPVAAARPKLHWPRMSLVATHGKSDGRHAHREQKGTP